MVLNEVKFIYLHNLRGSAQGMLQHNVACGRVPVEGVLHSFHSLGSEPKKIDIRKNLKSGFTFFTKT